MSKLTSSTTADPIAIIGMGCRYPFCNNPTEFWNLLVQGRDGVGPIPSNRSEKGILSTSYKYQTGNFLTIPIDEFDARFFEISPKSAKFMDPQLRLLMEVTWEALEDSFVNPENLRGTNTGVFVGAWRREYQNLSLLSPDKDFFSSYMGQSMSARLAFFLETTGPSLDTDTACSSSMVAVDLACKMLRSGNKSMNMAIVGGVNLLVEPPHPTYLDVSFATSADGKCKPFDVNADGYGIAEGCGVIVLKRLSDAVQSGDRILALIRGSAITQEGQSNSIGTPTVHTEALAMSLALEDANVDASKVQYIEAHGTGTKVGDPVEIKAIEKVYRSALRRSPLIIGSVKANIGHSESCSGVTSIIKVVLSLQHEIIPKHIHFTHVNPEIDLGAIPAILPMENLPWPRHADVARIAGASSHGISGTDAHVIIEEAPEVKNAPRLEVNDRPLHLLIISAKTEEALNKLIESYKDLFETSRDKFEDIAFTANTGRALFRHRIALVASNNLDAVEKLNQKKYFRKQVSNSKTQPRVCFLFPGQGSQYRGMAQELYSTSEVFKFHLDECCKILEEEGINLKSVLWGDNNVVMNQYSQVAIVSVDYCLFKLWESWGVTPDYVLPHSLGESAAVIAVGLRDLRSGIKAILLKTRLVDEPALGKMIALKLNERETQELVEQFLSNEAENEWWLDLAAINSAEQTVLSGRSDVVEKFHSFCESKNVKSVIIASAHAYHSRAVDPALEGIRKGILQIHGRVEQSNVDCKHSIKYISSSEGRLVGNEELLDETYWVNNTRNRVKFMNACRVALNDCRVFIEVGAHPILSPLVKANAAQFGIDTNEVICIPSLRRNESDWETILNGIAQFALTSKGNEFNWMEFEKPYGARRKVPLPYYPFDRRSFWIDINPKVGAASYSTEAKMHPLLGSQIQTATKTEIFQNEISVMEEAIDFLRDHKIHEHVIFPAAGFLEMCIAAISLSPRKNAKGTDQLSIQNLKVHNPLHLDESKPTLVQLTLEKASSGINLGIFSSKGNEWTNHCTANYLAQNVMEYPKSFNIEDFKSDKIDIDTLYFEELPFVGMNFGTKFQTMQDVRTDAEKNRALVSIELESAEAIKSLYFTHPLILDAMIQSTLVLLPNDTLHVPVSLANFSIVAGAEKKYIRKLFAHCLKRTENDKFFDVFLINERGSVEAFMEGLQMCTTTVENIERKLGITEKKDHLPPFWEIQWHLLHLNPPTLHTQTRGTWIILGSCIELTHLEIQMENMGRLSVIYVPFLEGDLLKDHMLQFLSRYSNSVQGILYLKGLESGNENSQKALCEPFLYTCQWIQESLFDGESHALTLPLKLVVVTRGTQLALHSDVVYNPSPSTLWGMAKTLKNECPSIQLKCIDLPAKAENEAEIETQVKMLCTEIFEKGDWTDSQIALRGNERYLAKLLPIQTPQSKGVLKDKPLFKERCSTYVITGGLKGLGFELAAWLLENGGKHVILVGRNPPEPEVADRIRQWNENGKKVHTFTADVGSFSECTSLFDWIRDNDLPPVRGIIHCAGVLADGAVSNQTWKKFETVFGPKIAGSWNLHKLSLYYKLDFFVTFSSISALFGISGQANYAAGNCYEDALIRYRHSLGLPGTTVNWGNWAEVGMASNLSFPGLKPIKIQQGLEALGHILRGNMRQVAVMTISSLHDFSRLCPTAINFVHEKLVKTGLQENQVIQPNSCGLKISTKDFWVDLIHAKENSEKLNIIQKYVGYVVKSMLKMELDEEIDVHTEFHKVGIDSLMTMELRGELQSLIGIQFKITLAHLRDFPSISLVSEMLLDSLTNTDNMNQAEN